MAACLDAVKREAFPVDNFNLLADVFRKLLIKEICMYIYYM
jgi:hypothetical protein